jgi:hypothetical protein
MRLQGRIKVLNFGEIHQLLKDGANETGFAWNCKRRNEQVMIKGGEE